MIPSELNVEATAWKKELLLEGVLKCLQEMKDTVGISSMHYQEKTFVIMADGHPDQETEDSLAVQQCVKYIHL